MSFLLQSVHNIFDVLAMVYKFYIKNLLTITVGCKEEIRGGPPFASAETSSTVCVLSAKVRTGVVTEVRHACLGRKCDTFVVMKRFR